MTRSPRIKIWIVLGGGIGMLAALLVGSGVLDGLGPAVRYRGPRMSPLTEQAQVLIDERILHLAASAASPTSDPGPEENRDLVPQTLDEQRERLLQVLVAQGGLDASALQRVQAIVEASPYMGFGNPAVSVHPLSRDQCFERRQHALIVPGDALCGSPRMVALPEGSSKDKTSAHLCIDQYEFPNVPCEYPLVWVRASEAASLCRAVGKRLCDAHEWEGACAGRLLSSDTEYDFQAGRSLSTWEHNRQRERVWATGGEPSAGRCATSGSKSETCVEVGWSGCGSNTFPIGSFPDCVSLLGVYDLHGNVAEHMNLPTSPEELGINGGLGQTEMKGSWFASDALSPYPDDCRWRAPAWHATRIDSPNSHRNYQLGFRCCRDLE